MKFTDLVSHRVMLLGQEECVYVTAQKRSLREARRKEVFSSFYVGLRKRLSFDYSALAFILHIYLWVLICL